MLQSLKIRNYALIEEINIDFNAGLTIITGETGAGKSIIIGALSLLTGARTEKTVLKDKEKKCVVESTFNIQAYKLKSLFEENNLDYEDITFIRREITPTGRSRAFINDTPVSLNLLRQITSKLIDIHSQHDNLLLNNPNYQLEVLDIYADNSELLEKYHKEYLLLISLIKKLDNLTEKAEKEKKETDYYQYQLEQLEKAKFKEGELEELEEEEHKLSHTEEIKKALSQISFLLNNEETGAIEQIRQAWRAAEQIANFMPKYKELNERIETLYIELQDIASETEIMFNDVEYDPERLQVITQRLDYLYELMHKFSAKSVQDLINIKQQLEEKLLLITNYDEQIQNLKLQIEQQEKKVIDLAQELSKRRFGSKIKLEKEILILIAELGMPNAKFEIKINKTKLTNTGYDQVIFLFSANKKIEPQPITKIASGGEFSRLMLAIKYIVSQSKTLPTIIFDEIDTGVSGEIAARMGQMIKKIATRLQVINITHLPQIAAKSDTHLLVYKVEDEQTTRTLIKKLNEKEKIHEIAKMLSGKTITQAAIEQARQLILN